VFKVLLD
jgi:hypothetical protein